MTERGWNHVRLNYVLLCLIFCYCADLIEAKSNKNDTISFYHEGMFEILYSQFSIRESKNKCYK